MNRLRAYLCSDDAGDVVAALIPVAIAMLVGFCTGAAVFGGP